MPKPLGIAPHTAHSAADTATNLAPAPVAPAADHSPAAAVLAALSAEPAGAAVARHAGISTAAARQALLPHEKPGTATRVKGSRPGIADTWTPVAASEAPYDEAPGTGGIADAGQPAAETPGLADVGQAAPAPAAGA